MLKSQLIDCVANGDGTRAGSVFDANLAAIGEALPCGDPVDLPSFGVFRLVGQKPPAGEAGSSPSRKTIESIPDPALSQEISDYAL